MKIKRVNGIRYSVLLWLLLCICSFRLMAQVEGDDCFSAINISNIQEYCSGPGIFTTEGATSSAEELPGCWVAAESDRDIWISFVPRLGGVYIQLNAAGYDIRDPALAIMEGRCGNMQEVVCGRAITAGQQQIERIISGLTPGVRYYLRITSSGGGGSFELCMDEFIPPLQPQADCDMAVLLCQEDRFIVENLETTGAVQDDLSGTCLPIESASVWYKWTADRDELLTFTITPNNGIDDIDFVIFELPGGIDDCANKQVVRCMASGETLGASEAQNEPCRGPTGLRTGDNDIFESAGCMPNDNNFLAPLELSEGSSYTMVINNYSQSGLGFEIDFGETVTFAGPKPDFTISAPQGTTCEVPIVFEDNSNDINTDTITSYTWNFGADATPPAAFGEGPHEAVYSSFGEKSITLTIESSRGCRSTIVQEVDILPCCPAGESFTVRAEKEDLQCAGDRSGRITLSATEGREPFDYRLGEGSFSPQTVYNELAAGRYQAIAQDARGCRDSVEVVLLQPEPLVVTIDSEMDSVTLGGTTRLFSEVTPTDRIFDYAWSPAEDFECSDCSESVIRPRSTTNYSLTVTDQDGCQASATLLLPVQINRQFYAPNAIYLPSSNGNEEFKVITNAATEVIELVEIYDRWGGVVYRAENIIYDDNTPGWMPEEVSGQELVLGTYTWMARIRYIDGVVEAFSGSVDVVK